MNGRLVTVGESLAVIRDTDPGGFSAGGRAVVGMGGAESNVAIAASRLGVGAKWVGRVGNDPFGAMIVRELRAEGVEVEVVVDDRLPTGALVKHGARLGTTRVTYLRAGSAATQLSAADASRCRLDPHDILHITGITAAISSGGLAAVRAAVERARAIGARVSFDVNHRSLLWSPDAAVSTYRDLVSAADLVFAGEDEADLVVGAGGGVTPESLARRLAALGPSEVVIKRGPAGAGLLLDGHWRDRPARTVDVVDTVGAGDAFVGAYLAAALLGWEPDARLSLAIRNGAAACTHPGDWEGAATMEELAAWREDRDPVAR